MSDWITSNPEILGGKSVIRSTRLAVDFLLGLLEQGWTESQILESYLHLSPKALQAVSQLLSPL
jgi:uncharacterized protein (DUF433 family)